MILRTLIPFLLLILLPDLYIHLSFIRKATSNGWLQAFYWLPTILLCLLLVGVFVGHYQHDSMFKYIFMLMLCLAVPKLLFMLVSCVGRAVGHFIPIATTVGNSIGLVLALSALGIFAYGFTQGWKHFVVREVTFASPDLPAAFDGYRIVQFSDLHIGTFHNEVNVMPQIVHLINNQKPDAIAFTGDLVNSYATELDEFMPYLRQLKAKDGVFAVLGNHDYGIHGRFASERERVKNIQSLKHKEQKIGWTLLLNDHRVIVRNNDSIAIVGVENDGRPPFPALGDLPRAQKGLAQSTFKVLLSHDPTHWHRKVLPNTSIQLTLSGHTHGMQFKLGSFSPSRWVYNEWGGLYIEQHRGLHVSLGLGEVMFPFRFGAWPEINVITLRKKQIP